MIIRHSRNSNRMLPDENNNENVDNNFNADCLHKFSKRVVDQVIA